MLSTLYILYNHKKWPVPSPHEINYVFDLKSNHNQDSTGFFHLCHKETNCTFLSKTTYKSNVGKYHQEYFLTTDLVANNLAFTQGGNFFIFLVIYFPCILFAFPLEN